MNPLPRKGTIVTDVTQELRQMILTGKLRPGDFLPSRKELATYFGVGLSSVHEAIQVLTAVGLVESHPGKGTWVRQDALDTLIHPVAVETRLGNLNARLIYETRSAIEVALTELAAQRAGSKEIEKIGDALKKMEKSVEDEDAFVKADLEFHLAVAEAGHNELLEQFYHLSRKLLSEAITELVRLPKVKEESIDLQRAIAQAIEEHNPQKAREAALEHMVYISHLLEYDAAASEPPGEG